jgi:hypothetical protein
MPQELFREIQYFRQSPVWGFLLFLPPVAFTSVLAYQLITGEPVGQRPMSNLSLAILSVCLLSIITWAYKSVKLTTIIDDEKIAFGWNMPTGELNEIPLHEISEWSIIKYSFVGYGYRVSRKYGSVHNLSGNKGLFIVTRSGDKILIGTHKLRELKMLLEKLPVGNAVS